jgi:phosphate-selective porin OprO/OprP
VGIFRLPAHRGAADVLAGPEGFGFLSKDNDFGMMLHWILQADVRGELAPLVHGAPRDTFLVRFAGLALSARFYERIRSELLVNFAGAAPSLSEAWVDAMATPWLHVKAGEFHYPISLERSTTGIFFPLVDADMASALLPSGDVGAQIWGRVENGLVEYNLALVNGAVAGGAPGPVDVDADKDFVGRVFVQPFLTTGVLPIAFFGVGFGMSDGVHAGSVASPQLPKLATWGGIAYLGYKNDGTAAGTALATGHATRFVPQASWHSGPVSAYGEYVRGFDDVAGSRVDYDGLGVVATVVPTGEDSVPLHYVVPRYDFAPAAGHWGALELTATIGGVRVSPGGAAASVSSAAGSRLTRAVGGGINWYPNLGVRVMVDAEHTTFEPLPGTSPIPGETLVVGRFQVVL